MFQISESFQKEIHQYVSNCFNNNPIYKKEVNNVCNNIKSDIINSITQDTPKATEGKLCTIRSVYFESGVEYVCQYIYLNNNWVLNPNFKKIYKSNICLFLLRYYKR